MQKERKNQDDSFDLGDRFGAFRDFGHTSMRSSIFGGMDPFDDTFFTRPSRSMFGPALFGSSDPSDNSIPPGDKLKGLVIEELNSDDDGEHGMEEEYKATENENETSQKNYRPGSIKEPTVEHPNDEDADDDGRRKRMTPWNGNKEEGSHSMAHNLGVQSCKVTYGGVDGAYYTSERTRRAGTDGMILEERKEADKSTGQATHRISRGIHDKGHSVTRNLSSDGEVNTVQTLHNLNEDELQGFEKHWKDNYRGHSHGLSEPFRGYKKGHSNGGQQGKPTWEDWSIPSIEHHKMAGGISEARKNTTLGARTKKVVRINIE